MRYAFAPHSTEETGSMKVKNIAQHLTAGMWQSPESIPSLPEAQVRALAVCRPATWGRSASTSMIPETDLILLSEATLSMAEQDSPLCLPQTEKMSSAL